MEEFVIDKNDELVMKLLHFFITEKNYNPIILHGAKNEIWLENMENDSYEIVRIVTNYIHNDEQLNFDLFRTKQITKRIKKKTFSFNMDVLSIFVNLGDSVDINKANIEHIDCASVKNIKDLKKYDFIMRNYPSITVETNFKEEGMNLFMKITSDINKKNEEENIKANNVFSKKVPYVTYAIIAINIIVFVLMHIFGNGSYDVETLLNFGAIHPDLVKAGEYYRLITCSFIHIGLFHLFFNMYALYIVGPQLESFYGKAKFLIIYLFSALMGSLFSCLFTSAVSAGASGAIFGLFGALIYFGYHYRVYLGNVIRSQIIPLLIFNFALGFILDGIDISAHIGGLIGGVLASQALGVKYKSSNSEKINGVIITIIFTVFMLYLLFR